MIEWWNSLGLASQILYCIAVPSTLLLLIQTLLMFFGVDDNAETDVELDSPDLEVGEVDIPDAELSELGDISDLESLNVFTFRGIISFLVIFGWVGIVMQSFEIDLAITLAVSTVCGVATMVLIAYLLRLVMRLRSSGTTDNRNALGSAGKVYLTIPASRSGEGKVNIMLQGTYVERNAVTDEAESIPTGCEIIVVGTSGQTSLVVKRK
jgi:membrane protein implicated in regulation of membrane protease activity